jgi:DNA-binding MarR family transcriptional regulator
MRTIRTDTTVADDADGSVNEPSADELRADILRRFGSLMQHVARWRQLDLADVEVTMPQARCLALVDVHPSMPISDLAAHLRIGLPAASGLVERLVVSGHLERRPDANDRRHQLVALTPRGQALVDRLHELPAGKLGELIAGCSQQELRGLRQGVVALEREARRIAEQVPQTPEPERTRA